MAENITRCPKCYTSFRISDAHLNTEKGAVRCGSCLNIFNARENLINIEDQVVIAEPKAAAPKSESPDIKSSAAKAPKHAATQYIAKPSPAKSSTKDDIGDNKKDAPASRTEPATASTQSSSKNSTSSAGHSAKDTQLTDFSQASASAHEKPKPNALYQYDDDGDDEDFDDDALISDDMMISDDMDAPTSTGGKKRSYMGSDVNDGFDKTIFGSSATGEYEFNLFERESAQDDDKDEKREDESWALDLLENDEKEDAQKATTARDEDDFEEEERHITEEFEASYYKNSFQIIDEDEKSDSERRKTETQKIATEVFQDYDELEVEEYDYSDDAAFYAKDDKSSNYLDAIEPEPVEFSWQRHSTLWDSKLLWGAGSLLAGILLLGQIAWIKFDSLSVVEPYRAYYSKACAIFGCELPVLIDRSKIRTTNLVVRSHPTENNALIVDAVLQNTAKFEQSFPTLDLVFTNNQDKIVAARRLSPEDYLAGELAGRSKMPVKQPIHVAIEIVDPGSEAVGYKISIAN